MYVKCYNIQHYEHNNDERRKYEYLFLKIAISGSSTPGDAYNPPPSTHVVGSSRSDDVNPTPPVMSSSSRRNDHRWDHIDNLDRFFTLVYEYHQGGGFLTIAVKKVLGLAQFVFVV
ncbi:unnamed protein product, partial [Strongylus vulgaris]